MCKLGVPSRVISSMPIVSLLTSISLIAISQFVLVSAVITQDNQNDITVTGLVIINDKTFRATCNCPANVNSLENMIYLSRGLCYPSKMKVRTHGNLDHEEYDSVLKEMRIIPHEDFRSVDEVSLSAMDPRVKGKAMYAPGGDLGLFTIAMMVVYESRGTPTQMTVTNLLKQFVRQLPANRQFRHATDEHAIELLKQAMNWEVIDLHNVEKQYQQKMKDAIADGAMGDPFFVYMMRKFNNDPTKKKIVVLCVHAFLEVLWDKTDSIWERMVIQMLEGDAKPTSLVELSVSKGCELAKMAPLVKTQAGSIPLLIYTEFAANVRKREMAAFIYSQQDPTYRTVAVDDLLSHVDKLTHTLMEGFAMQQLGKVRYYNLTYV
ncbi:uncharacterized protein BBOV_IV005440 [Babesia bovis T2Bo]|uniref:uncharacterized protein n=1 Tax=Babesia bovis T2Bo TaxID=484906 RepID=UPI001E091285|nr:uncharacterized protein BBOV_IV005440 [Babesia bovis T2Bo]EDO06905.2 putative integral membrane protein [Babesia bovis T2Bo]